MKRFIALMTLLLFSFCSNESEELDGLLAGPQATSNGSTVLFFNGIVDNSQTPSCGTVTADSTTSSGSTGTTGTTTTTTEVTKHLVDSFYRFEYGEIMRLKYQYNENRNLFTLTPLVSSSQTCQTSNFITCDGLGAGTCETADNINCGGTYAFQYLSSFATVNGVPYAVATVTFQGYTGSIDWSNGIVLSDDEGELTYADLDINMVASDGSVFKGSVYCESDYN